MITSKSNPQLKKIKKLMTSAKERTAAGVFVAEGERAVREAPKSWVRTLCVSESYKGELLKHYPEALVFSDECFRALSDTVNPQGVLAVVNQPGYHIRDIVAKAPDKALYIILDDIRDPGNLGTIIRTAEACGAAVIMSRGCVDVFSPKVIRSTMGSIYRVPIAVCHLKDAVAALKEGGVEVYATALDASLFYDEIRYGDKNAFIIGNEARGISDEVLALADVKIKIPMKGQVESLNAAISAAVIMFGVK